MTPLRSLAPVLALALLLPACTETDPKKPGTWIAQLDRKDPKKVTNAARELRKMKAKEAVPALLPLLRHEDYAVREEAAYALGEIGDTSAVQALVDGLDLAAAKAGRSNARIAAALGDLGDKSAVPALLRVLDSKDDYARLAAVDALGHLKDKASVPALRRLIEQETTAPLVTKKAIIALGEMQAAEAVPSLLQALVVERQGVSFFLESSYSLFQMGAPAGQALMKVLDGTDKAFLRWADEHNRAPAGYLSKAAIVLADLGWKDAAPALVKLMKWEDPNGNEAFQMLVQAKAAEALGRMRARSATSVIAAGLKVEEANVRETYAYALAWIGDKAAVPALAAMTQKGSWSARSAAITGLALLGDSKSKALLEGIAKKQTGDLAFKDCMDEEGAPTEPVEMKKARCDKQRTDRPTFMKEEIARLVAGDCKEDVDCWIGKLKDPIAKVRERAAYELGKLQDTKGLEALCGTCKDDDRLVRRASYIAFDWFVPNPAAKAFLEGRADKFAQQLEEEKGRAHTVVVNEDLRRVVWKIRHLPWSISAGAEAGAMPAMAPGK